MERIAIKGRGGDMCVALAGAEDFPALRPAWDALVAKGRRQSVFVSHEWFDAAWQWRRDSARLYTLCTYLDGDLVAALPLCIGTRHWAGTVVRELTFLTVPDTQLCDLVVRDGDREAAAEALALALRERQADWDVLRLGYLPERSEAVAALGPALARNGFGCRVRPCPPNSYLSLETSWEDYYETRSRSLKKANNLAANRLNNAGSVEIEWFAPGTGDERDVARVVRVITDISARSWKSATGTSLDNAGPRAFLERLSQLAHGRGWLSVWILKLDGKPVAMEYQLVADGSVYALRSDFDDAIDKQASPGSHLNRQLIERLFGRGLTRYFMGPGKNPYKQRWSQGADPLYVLSVYGRSLRGRALQAWEVALRPAARAVRDKFRKPATTPVAESPPKSPNELPGGAP